MPVLVALVAPAGAVADQDASSSSSPGVVVSAGLVALCGAATDDGLLKRLNLDVLMHTRAEDARVRIVALRCARTLWTAHGSKLIGAWGVGGVVTMCLLTDAFLFLFSRFRDGDGNIHRRVRRGRARQRCFGDLRVQGGRRGRHGRKDRGPVIDVLAVSYCRTQPTSLQLKPIQNDALFLCSLYCMQLDGNKKKKEKGGDRIIIDR